MNWYRLLYDSPSGAKDRPDKPEPTGWKCLPYIFFRQIWNLIGLNILFWAFCLPIVTIPSALKAMTRVCVNMLEGESIDLFHDFWKSFREGFFRTTAVGLGLALLLWAVGTGLWLCAGAMVSNGLFAAPAMLLLIAAVMIVMSAFSLFPLLEFSELTIGQCLRNAVLLTLVSLKRHLAVLLLLAALFVGYLACYPYSTVLLASILLSSFWLCTCFAVWPGIKRYVFEK